MKRTVWNCPHHVGFFLSLLGLLILPRINQEPEEGSRGLASRGIPGAGDGGPQEACSSGGSREQASSQSALTQNQ